jgi:hypothetical protein
MCGRKARFRWTYLSLGLKMMVRQADRDRKGLALGGVAKG